MTDRAHPQRRPEPTPEVLERIAEAVDRFEALWRRGDRPSLADHCAGLDGHEGDHLLCHLLRVEIDLRRRGGEAPDRSDYLSRWPGREAVVHEAFESGDGQGEEHVHHWPATLSSPTEAEEVSPRPDQALTAPFAQGFGTGVPRMPGYRIVGVIERGAMGVVYKAWQECVERYVAIKSVLPGVSHERFRREAKLIARIQSPHVVQIHDLQPLADGGHAIVMEYVEGTDLARVIKERGGALDEAQVLPWMRDVARGMCAAADALVIHRDLKPSNILIDRAGRARVADFGLGRGVGDVSGELTRADDVLGTPYYMAPEQAEDPLGVDTRADVYSFGATFYHALTGAPPFDGRTFFTVMFKHKTEPLASPRFRNPALSERTAEVLERCLAKAPGDRFADFHELARHLEPRPAADSPWETYQDETLERFFEAFRPKKASYLDPRLGADVHDRFPFPGGRTLTVLRGDITRQEVDAIVSSDDEFLTMGGGVSLAIRRNGGAVIRQEAQRYVPVRPGRAVVTSAGSLPARFVFHGVTLSFENWGMIVPSRDLIAEIVASCFYQADTLNLRSIAMPLLGTGTGGFSREVCLDTVVRSIARALLHGTTCVEDARVVIYP